MHRNNSITDAIRRRYLKTLPLPPKATWANRLTREATALEQAREITMAMTCLAPEGMEAAPGAENPNPEPEPPVPTPRRAPVPQPGT